MSAALSKEARELNSNVGFVLTWLKRHSPDARFLESFALIERASTDERNFVKKAVSWTLRGIGKRNAALHAAAVRLARRLAESPHPAARWTSKDALRDLATAATLRRFAKKQSRGRGRSIS